MIDRLYVLPYRPDSLKGTQFCSINRVFSGHRARRMQKVINVKRSNHRSVPQVDIKGENQFLTTNFNMSITYSVIERPLEQEVTSRAEA